MKFVVIGTGFIFRRHLLSIRETGGEIIDVCNEEHGRGQEWKKVVKNPDADCVVILTPNYLHYSMALAASEAGKIVLCEKPLTIISDDARELAKRKNIFVVQQLRHHPGVKKLKSEISSQKKYNIKIDVSVHRDEYYFNGWKGSMEKSGGPIFTTGVHYFELMLYLFGTPLEAKMTYFDGKTGEGAIKGENYDCEWRISVAAPLGENMRFFNVDGIPLNLSSKENLAEENLHQFVYADLLQVKGVTPAEALPGIELIEKIYESYNS